MRGSWLLRCRYNGRLAARLWWLPRARWPCRSRSRSAAAAFNYQLDSLFAKSKNEPDITASLRRRPRAKPLADSPPAVDLAIARAALSEVLSSIGKDAAVPWENRKTGAHGTITSIASA